ncbi:hypothetical protein, partial [Staphylococcus epidermidis]|uniref:hypothetical protein n=1 Tax=Staphylococcus epidermidis TaxID=1282 RepID=UPI001C932A60
SPTHPPLLLSHIKQPTEIIQPFIQPIQPPYSKQTIPHPQTHQLIIPPHQLITPHIPKQITHTPIHQIYIPSPFTSNTPHPLSQKSYPKNLPTPQKVQ